MLKTLKLTIVICSMLLAGACSSTNQTGLLPGPSRGDTIDPTIAIAGVTDGTTISGTVAISGAATDNIGVTAFNLTIDGTQVASATTGVLAYSWVTTSATNAPHVLVFTASDAASNSATQTINVTVNNGGSGGGAGTLSGTIFAPNGTDPVAGALIFVQDLGTSAVGNPPSEPYKVYTYSEANGGFSLPGVQVGPQTIKIVKGAFFKILNLDVQAGNNVLTSTQTRLPADDSGGAGDILVVTGNYDSIQNVLAKLGLGTSDSFGQLELGTETFDLVDGNSNLADGTYPNFIPFFSNSANYAQYRTIFLNCGIDNEDAFFDDPAAVAALRAWVENGGHLYCTDWSYNFIEQLWPEKIDFESAIGDSDGLTTTPEQRDFAKVGNEMASLNCQIEDSGLAAWMTAISASTTGDNFITTDWLPAWVPMDAVATTGVKVWANGTPTGDPLRPMTVTFNADDGVVLFSSYQERVLQYLIFEVL
jgi:hypothetical protein